MQKESHRNCLYSTPSLGATTRDVGQMLQKNRGAFIIRTTAIVELMGFEREEIQLLVAPYWRIVIVFV